MSRRWICGANLGVLWFVEAGGEGSVFQKNKKNLTSHKKKTIDVISILQESTSGAV